MSWQMAAVFLALAACATVAPLLRTPGARLRFRLRRGSMERSWQAWLKSAGLDEKLRGLHQTDRKSTRLNSSHH